MTTGSEKIGSDSNSTSETSIDVLMGFVKRMFEIQVEKFAAMSPEEQEPIRQRALELRFGPTGYDDTGALSAAISELVKVTDEEIGVSEEVLHSTLNTPDLQA